MPVVSQDHYMPDVAQRIKRQTEINKIKMLSNVMFNYDEIRKNKSQNNRFTAPV